MLTLFTGPISRTAQKGSTDDSRSPQAAYFAVVGAQVCLRVSSVGEVLEGEYQNRCAHGVYTRAVAWAVSTTLEARSLVGACAFGQHCT